MWGDTQQMEKRIQWLDLVRTAAIICVVLCHTTEQIYQFKPQSSSLGLVYQISKYIFFSIGRLGVPLFMLSSGYLLLDRPYNEQACIRFWKNNSLRLFLCTECWFLLYDIYLHLANNAPLSPVSVAKDLLFVSAVQMPHTWYMPMILGMYVLFPFVANALRSMKPSMLLVPLAIYIFYAFAFPYIKAACKLFGFGTMKLQFSTGFSGGYYGLYFILGYAVKKNLFKKIPRLLLATAGCVSFLTVVGVQVSGYLIKDPYNVWYDDLFLLLCSLCLFESFSRIGPVKAYRLIRCVSRYSFAIYLIHVFVLFQLSPLIQLLAIPKFIKVPVTCLLSALFSLLMAFIIGLIPKAGKYLLYIK